MTRTSAPPHHSGRGWPRWTLDLARRVSLVAAAGIAAVALRRLRDPFLFGQDVEDAQRVLYRGLLLIGVDRVLQVLIELRLLLTRRGRALRSGLTRHGALLSARPSGLSVLARLAERRRCTSLLLPTGLLALLLTTRLLALLRLPTRLARRLLALRLALLVALLPLLLPALLAVLGVLLLLALLALLVLLALLILLLALLQRLLVEPALDDLDVILGIEVARIEP